MGRKPVPVVMAIALLVFTVLALTLAPFPAVSAKTLKCDHVIHYNDWGASGPNHPGETWYWMGDITGGITGTCYFWETERNYIVGSVMHFFEDFYIDLGDGWVSGYDNGIWNFATFKYRAHGWITDASENYAHMIGCKFYEEGVTSNPDVLPIIDPGTCFFGPPTGHGHSGTYGYASSDQLAVPGTASTSLFSFRF